MLGSMAGMYARRVRMSFVIVCHFHRIGRLAPLGCLYHIFNSPYE